VAVGCGGRHGLGGGGWWWHWVVAAVVGPQE